MRGFMEARVEVRYGRYQKKRLLSTASPILRLVPCISWGERAVMMKSAWSLHQVAANDE